MKDRFGFDIGQMMDDIFEATQNFGEAFKNGFSDHAHGRDHPFRWDENVDYYPHHSYPPSNIYMREDRTLVLEFALAGFEEGSIDLQFRNDHLVLNAEAPASESTEGGVRYFKRRLKMKSVENQKYYAPEDKFDREKVTAVYKNGLLRVTIPSRETVASKEGVRVVIVNEETEKKKGE